LRTIEQALKPKKSTNNPQISAPVCPEIEKAYFGKRQSTRYFETFEGALLLLDFCYILLRQHCYPAALSLKHAATSLLLGWRCRYNLLLQVCCFFWILNTSKGSNSPFSAGVFATSATWLLGASAGPAATFIKG